jgi:uncharacterized membrane protein YraQ (UPF0718 family)
MKLRSWLKQNWLVMVVFGVLAVAIAIEPARAGKSVVIGLQTFISVGAILFTVFVFMGMFSVWVSENQVARHLGKESGAKGLIYGAALGTIYHGPQVSVFPFLRTMLNKGARLSVVVAVVSAYAIKLPMMPLEIALLGLKFTVVHNLLLLVTAPLLGIVMERLLRGRARNGETG